MCEGERQRPNSGEENGWRSIDQPSGSTSAAIYEIRLVDEVGDALSIPRFLGEDADGILSIGLASNIERRRRQFACGMANCYGHSEGNLFNLLRRFSRIQDVYPAAKCQYRFTLGREEDLAVQERSAIKGYVRRFGEVPPLNSAIPGRYHLPSWEELASEVAQLQEQDEPTPTSPAPNDAR